MDRQEIDIVFTLVDYRAKREPPSVLYGDAWFRHLAQIAPRLSNEIRGTTHDPRYGEHRIPAAKSYLMYSMTNSLTAPTMTAPIHGSDKAEYVRLPSLKGDLVGDGEQEETVMTELTTDPQRWEEVIEGDPSRLHYNEGVLVRVGSATVLCHLEAWQIEEDGEMVQRAVDPDEDETLAKLHAVVGADGAWQTIEINGHDYVVCMTPFC